MRPYNPIASLHRLGILFYRSSLPTDTDVTFGFTSGGHNGGILSAPRHARRIERNG
jgi:hypothetical protein